MKKVFLLFFCLFYYAIAIGQKEITITGIITNTKGAPLSYIDVLLKKNDSLKSLVAYAITDNLGRYKIIHQTKQNEFILETSSLIYESVTKILNVTQNTQKFNEDIILKERTVELQEIEITATPRVQIRNDTTIFNIKKLTDGTERVVEEILKKLPGITINDKGKLKFKGKDISNVLIEGDNLFNGNYTVGTQNINASHIKGIEAIENFEGNPLLQGLSQNDEVALNLKFGEGVSLSGEAEISYASKNRYAINTTAIGISKKLKGFSIISYNSIGNQNKEQFDAVGFIQNLKEQYTIELTAPNYIGNKSKVILNNNSILNNEFFGSINILPKLSKTETLRLNIDAFSDKSLESKESLTIVDTDTNNPIRIEQSNRNLIKPFYLNSSLMFQKYLSSKSFWKTNFIFSKLRDDKQLLGIRNNQEQEENMILKELFLSNNIIYTYRINKKSAINIEGLMSFSEKPESLVLFPGFDFNTNSIIEQTKNNQKVYSNKRTIYLLTNYYKKIRKEDKFNLKFNLNYVNNRLNSILTNFDKNIAFQNNVNYSVFLPEISSDYLFKQKRLSIRSKLNVKLYSYAYTDKIVFEKENNHEMLFDVSIRFKYEFNKKNSLLCNFDYLNSIPKEENLYTNYILRSNRLLENNVLNFNKLASNNLNIFYHYDNLSKDTDIRLGFKYKKEDNTYLSSNIINNDIYLVTNFLQNNGSENRIWNLSFTKYISPLRSTFRLTSMHNNTNYFNLVNGSELRFNKRKLTNVSLSIGTSFIGKFLFGNNLTYSQSVFFTQGALGFKNQLLVNNFNISYISNEHFRIDADANYYLPNINNQKNNTFKLNASMKLLNKKKTITYSLEGRNLLNQSSLGRVNNTDFSTTTSSESLFERILFFTVSFKY